MSTQGLNRIQAWYTDQVLLWLDALNWRIWVELGCPETHLRHLIRRG